MNRVKPVISLGLVCILTIVITGCNLFRKDTITDTEVSRTKNSMNDKLNNYSIDVTITSQTPVADVDITMHCIEDNKNKIEYCKMSTLGIIETEQYIDYNNNKSYIKSNSLLKDDDNKDKWVIDEFKDKKYSNPWIDLNDYLRDIKVENSNGGKLYKGTIGVKKLTSAISKTDKASNIKIPSLDNKAIPIEVFINKDGYIEYANTSFKFVGIKEVINIKYSNYNSNKDLVLPKV